MSARLLRRLRRNAWSVLALLARDALRPKNLLAIVGLAVGVAALGGSYSALAAGQAVTAAGFLAVAVGALYGAVKSYFGSPMLGAAVFVAGLLVAGGVTHALGPGETTGVDDATTSADLSPPSTSETDTTGEGAGVRVPASPPGHGDGYDCADFQSQRAAQNVFETASGADSLDADGDGVACEHLP